MTNMENEVLPNGEQLNDTLQHSGSTANANLITIESEQPITEKPKHLMSTVAFVDYEHWFNSLNNLHGRRPNIQAWFHDIKKRGRLVEVTFFGDFSESKGMSKEINYIRQFTSRIIETKNTSKHLKKNFTDFIMLDNIYQKVISSPEIEQVVLFTGDGDFSSVVSYLRNFCDKVVGVYGVENALSIQLDNTSDWCERVPFKNETYMECRIAIIKNIQFIWLMYALAIEI